MRKKRTRIEIREGSECQRLVHIVLLLADNARPLSETNIRTALNELFYKVVKMAVDEADGNYTEAGRRLGIERTTLSEYLRRKTKKGGRKNRHPPLT